MIRLVFHTDAARSAGASTEAGTQARHEALPPGLMDELHALLVCSYAVVGRRAAHYFTTLGSELYVLSRDPDYEPPGQRDHVHPCPDPRALVARFGNAQETLTVLGGISTFRAFLPHASRLCVAEAYAPLPGDLVFDEWDDGRFVPESIVGWEGGRTIRYRRRE